MSRPEIPVRNLYYLLLYAWRQLDEGQLVDVEGMEHAGTAELLSRVLVAGARHVLRRGLDRGYVARTEAAARLRGRIEFAPSARRLLLQQGRAVCTADELTPDVLTNRILRTTLARMARVATLDPALRDELRAVHARLGGVREVHVTRAVFGRVRVHAGNAFYRFLMSTCALCHENLLPTPDGHGERFRDFRRDEGAMSSLFEAFVLGFYQRELPAVDSRAETMAWAADPLFTRGHGQMPSMRTDVTLRGDGWTCVLDTKYYRKALSRWHADGTFSSANLYQMTAYLRALQPAGGADARADGVLLYPVVQGSFDHAYRIDGHRLRLLTLDLRQPWPAIPQALCEIAEWSAARA